MSEKVYWTEITNRAEYDLLEELYAEGDEGFREELAGIFDERGRIFMKTGGKSSLADNNLEPHQRLFHIDEYDEYGNEIEIEDLSARDYLPPLAMKRRILQRRGAIEKPSDPWLD